MWADGLEFAEQFGLSDSDLPQIMAVSPDTLDYLPLPWNATRPEIDNITATLKHGFELQVNESRQEFEEMKKKKDLIQEKSKARHPPDLYDFANAMADIEEALQLRGVSFEKMTLDALKDDVPRTDMDLQRMLDTDRQALYSQIERFSRKASEQREMTKEVFQECISRLGYLYTKLKSHLVRQRKGHNLFSLLLDRQLMPIDDTIQ